MSSEIHHFISWKLPTSFEFFFNYGWTFGESNNNKYFQIWWISETKLLVYTLRLWSLTLSPQIRQSEARCWTWISITLLKLFWPWKEIRQRLLLMRKKVITRLCHVCVKPGSGTRSRFEPRNSKIIVLKVNIEVKCGN